MAREEAPPALPSLDEWIDEFLAGQESMGYDFYSQAEWMELYEDAHGLAAGGGKVPATSVSRTFEEKEQAKNHERPAQERRRALEELQAALAVSIKLSDRCSAWFSDSVAANLSAGGVETIEDLGRLVNEAGFRWHTKVPGIGSVLAARIIGWLAPTLEDLGRPLARTSMQRASVLRHERQKCPALPQFGIRAMELLKVPHSIDGSNGDLRDKSKANAIGVNTDLEAISAWIRQFERSARTQATYKREAERFYLWCVVEMEKPMSSVTSTDLVDYQKFLAAPPFRWVAGGQEERTSEAWRPFKGPLSPLSQRHSFTVVAALLSWLVEEGYLVRNPAKGIKRKLQFPSSEINIRRSFTEKQMKLIVGAMASMPDTPGTRRSKLVMKLGTGTGLRLVEMATCRRRDLALETVDGKDVWILSVLGKGRKKRRLVIDQDLVLLIEEHHRDMEAAGTAFEPKIETIRTLATAGTGSGAVVDKDDRAGLRPLIGAIQKPPAKWGNR